MPPFPALSPARLFDRLRAGSDARDEMLGGPIRGELLGAEHLADRARALARGQRVLPGVRGPRRTPLLVRLDATDRILQEAFERLATAADADVDVSPAGVWLLDNGHVVDEHISEVRESLPRGYYRELPRLAGGPLAGYPRVYEVAIALISHTEGRIDGDNVDLFIAAFQEVAPLTIGELWAIPAMLRLGLLENVRRMAIRTVRRLEQVEEADEWAGRILGAADQGAEVLSDALDEFVADPPERSAIFVSRLLAHLRPSRAEYPPLAWLEHWLAEDGFRAEDAASQAAERLAHTQIMMANSLTSLRAIARIDWRGVVERRSALEAALRTDPAGFHARMTFATRDQYRHVAEQVAKRGTLGEVAVAERAVALAGAALAEDPTDTRRGHAGYWLVDEGRVELDRAAGYRPTPGERLHRLVLGHPNVVFVGGVAAGTAIALAIALGLAGPEARVAWPLVLAFTLLPAADIAVNVMNQLVTAFLPPRLLPKLDLNVRGGIPPEFRTAVVVPTLFGSVAAVREALEHLEVQYLANREAHLHFALLSDFTDAPTETVEGDDAILATAVAGVQALNQRYAPETGDAFYLLHRPRRWNPQQGAWMGWERKRGKLAEFNRFVRGKGEGAFSEVVGDPVPLQQVRYVITLDADTVLPPDAAALLVGALAHPLNRAVYDAGRGRVARGYGILQPRVGVTLPSAHRSRFASIHSGHPGVDPYTTAVSDVYQDLYGEGSFTGKGIYDVDAFEQATHGRFPENTLLSHDLIEGNYARAGLATDIKVYDDYPARYLTFARRKHRWIRGDWQLLGWLTPRVPGPDGPERNRLSLLSRWKILDNLRRSTVEVAQLALFAAGWTVLPGDPMRWTLLGLGAVAAPWIVAMLLAVLRPPLDKSWRAYYRAVAGDAATSVLQVALAVTFLPHQAWISLDAIARTLWRLFVSRRNLLEWQAAAQTEQSLAGSAREAWRLMAPGILLAAGILLGAAALALLRPPAGVDAARRLGQVLGASVPILLAWLAAPSVAWALGRRPRRQDRPLPAELRSSALRLAELHWRYFGRFVTAETHWLAPDNFQDDPAPVLAMRTSPTNIGLQLLATVSAFDLGFLPAPALVERLEGAFRSLERMERFKGHFYNWYDLRDLRVLDPPYVSTVDSGNLAGHLLALRQACRQVAGGLAGDGSADLARRLHAIADRARDYVREMDFGFLFDRERRLFAIGYQGATHSLDPSLYDLLASEARLASFLAVAKKDVPVDHWFRLGRGLTSTGRAPALVSWSGSMFEYLMPLLVMRSYPYTLLDQTYRGAVRRQAAWGDGHGVPWGVSESAYNRRDRELTYQYRGFGVPDLALKRGLGRDLVVAPYASALALMVEPKRAMANLARLERMGMLGAYGFREAVDFTRPLPNQRWAVVDAYFAHHVGMTLVALTNLLTGGRWQRRFHRDPMVRSAELLLHERVPRRLAMQDHQVAAPEEALPDPDLERPSVREVTDPDAPEPRVALLGRPPYTVLVSHSGAGSSRWEGRDVMRWRADGTTDATGQFCYVKDLTAGRAWSAGHQPTCAPADSYRALLATDRVTIHRADGRIETRTEIAVVPEDAAEVRRVTVTNNGPEPREVELTSYGEVVLAPHDADRAHPAFSSLFVQTEWHEWCTALTAVRRPRAAGETPLWCVHVVDDCKERRGPVSWETDRARFLGRGRTVRDPMALTRDGPLGGTTGAVLDPILAIRMRVRLAPGQSASVAFTTVVATTPERAFEMAGRYHESHAAQRALDLAWTTAQVELRELEITPADVTAYQHLAGHLVYAGPEHRAPAEELLQNRGAQDRLWGTGISGDWPILLATIEAEEGLPTLRQLLAAHNYWRRRGLAVDLVVLNQRPSSYLRELEEKILAAMATVGEVGGLERPGGIHVRRRDLLDPTDLLMLRASARVIIPCDGRGLGRILEAREEARREGGETDGGSDGRTAGPSGGRTGGTPEGRRAEPPDRPTVWLPDYPNGHGRLLPDGRYEIGVAGDHLPPAPWVNVIANPQGGFVVSERGTGCTWAGNSYFFRLTPWHNDPVSDPPGDALWLRDDVTGERWGPTPAPLRHEAPYTVRHGPGRTTFEHAQHGIATELTLGIAPDAAVKLALLRVSNRSGRARRLTLTAYAEWTLGVHREQTALHLQTRFDAARRAMFARNHFDPAFGGWTAFHAVSEPVTGHTGDRKEFVGRNGWLGRPAAGRLEGATGAGLDPCSALECRLALAAGESREVVVLLGAAEGEEAATALVDALLDPARARAAVESTVAAWDVRLSAVTVRTPEPTFDALLNHWALYQALTCRMWARTALYQSSGAYGFRDQLQDVTALLHAEPGLARAHLVRAAGRQFAEGDVQHWWHPQSGRGVRTRFSDDLAWLPYAVAHYVRTTGDASVLDETAPFLTMRALEPGEHEIYDLPGESADRATVYEHCLRALRRACTAGAHGLPLIGGGDWNDGMNRVGAEGRGESVWLAWFLIAVLRDFAECADLRGDAGTAAEFRARASEYAAAAEHHGWDGAWYRRAYYDDGTPLGTASADECRIDSVAQSWSVLSGAGDPTRRAQAMRAFEEHLVDGEARLLKLLAPPFDATPQDPGYIKGYLPGVRENGAQYTHAALWAVLATALEGRGERALELFQMINPLARTGTPEEVARYQVEPYAVPADVYSAPGQVGRGGWTWYTGSASWAHRVGLEGILGLVRRGSTLTVTPRVPADWREFSVDYRFGGSTYAITVRDPGRVDLEGAEVTVDGRRQEWPVIDLVDDGGRHEVVVVGGERGEGSGVTR